MADGYVIADGVRLVTTTAGEARGVYYVHNDHLGTPQVLTDNDQNVAWQAEYDPFGKATVTTEVVTNNVRYPGLHYNYFRTNDPATGRYITSDPIGLDGGVNTFGYVSGNRVVWNDPTGELPTIPPSIRKYIAVISIGLGLGGSPTLNPNDGNKPSSPAGTRVEEVIEDNQRKKPINERPERAKKPASPEPKLPKAPQAPKPGGPYIIPRFPLLLCPACPIEFPYLFPPEDPLSC